MKKPIIFATTTIIVVWILVLFIPSAINIPLDDPRISNAINAAVAIGTIGAVLTALYLSEKRINVKKVSFTLCKKSAYNNIENAHDYRINYSYEIEITNNTGHDIQIQSVMIDNNKMTTKDKFSDSLYPTILNNTRSTIVVSLETNNNNKIVIKTSIATYEVKYNNKFKVII